MEVTYTMIGVDGRQYGPISLEQLRDWLRQGRLTAETQILRSDVNSWLPAAQYAELGISQSAPAAAGTPPAFSPANANNAVAIQALEKRINSSAGWFFLIGGLSLVNSLVALSGSNWRFLVGLGITDVITVFTAAMSGGGIAIGVILNLLVTGVFMLFGFFARKRHTWSFIAGMICYALDGGVLLLIGADTMNLIFHCVALVFMFLGVRANLNLKALQRGAVA